MRKRVSRLGAAVFIAAAMSATGASAAQAHQWLVEGTPIAPGLSDGVVVSKTEPFHFNLNYEGTTSLKWSCSTLTVLEGTITSGGGGRGDFRFSSCTYENNPLCTIEQINVTERLSSELTGAESTLYDKFAPLSSKRISTWKLSGGCGSPINEWKLEGSFGAQISGATELEHTFTVSPAITKAAGANLHSGLSPVEMSGAFTYMLTGATKGKKWGAE